MVDAIKAGREARSQAYQAVVLAKWAKGDYSERRSLIDFPPEFDNYVQRSYTALKAKQQRLMHNSVWSLYHQFINRKRR